MCFTFFFLFLSFLKKCVGIRQVGPEQPGWNVNHATGWQIGEEHAFHLNYRLDKECTIFSAMYEQEKTFPGYFSFAFLTLIGLEAGPCDPAGSIFHNKAKNMPEMFSLAQCLSVKHESNRTPFPADSISPFPGESSTVILPFCPSVIFLIGSITWHVVPNGIIVEMYSVSL